MIPMTVCLLDYPMVSVMVTKMAVLMDWNLVCEMVSQIDPKMAVLMD